MFAVLQLMLLAAVVIVFVAGLTADGRSSSQPPPPNIVFVLADDYGFADVGFHGSALRTPNLDSLATSGVRLDNYYVQPICTPTRSQLLSGRYQIHTGLQHSIIWPCQRNSLPLELPTIADKLREQGYSTHMVGKWHIGYYEKQLMPNFRGFDSYFGYLLGSENYYDHHRCYSFRSQSYFASNNSDLLCGFDLRDNINPTKDYAGQYSTHLFAEKAVEIISRHSHSEDNKPLFLYLPFQAVHAPLQVPEAYMEPYANITDKARRTYAGMVSCLDEAVGNITEALKTRGLWNNTIFIFSTDNGGQVYEGGNNWPLRGWKGSLFEGGMRGVAFVNSPLIKKRGVIYPGLLHVSDWFPTLLKLAGGRPDSLKLDGYDVWKSISEGAESPRVELLHNIDPLDTHGSYLNISDFDNRITAAIRVGKWKLITGNAGNGSWIAPPEDSSSHSIPDSDPKAKNIWLFDLSTDPLEKNDLFESNKEVAIQLLNRLSDYQSTAVPPRYPKDDPLCDPDLHNSFWSPWVENF